MRRLVNWVWFVPVSSGVLLWQAQPIRQFLLTNLVRSSFGDHLRLRIPLQTIALSLDKMGDFPFKDPDEAHYHGQTLIVRGTKSRYVADDVLPLVGRFFPTFKLIDIDSGHWVISEKPEAFRQGTTRCSSTRSQCWCASRRGLLAGGRGKRNMMSLASITRFAAPTLQCSFCMKIFVDRQHERRWTRELAGRPLQMLTLLALFICDGSAFGNAISASKQYQRWSKTGKVQPMLAHSVGRYNCVLSFQRTQNEVRTRHARSSCRTTSRVAQGLGNDSGSRRLTYL